MILSTISDKVTFYEKVFGTGFLARNGKNFGVWCPICAPSKREKRKLIIRVEDDACHCWTCSYRARSLIPLLIKFGTREQLAEYKEKFLPEGKHSSILTGDMPEEKLSLPRDVMLLAMAPKNDPDVKAALRYSIDARGLTQNDLWYYKISVSNDYRWKRRVIVPSFDKLGRLNYFVGRAIDSNRFPKYDNPDVDKLQVIFNEINVDWTKQLVLCEGPFDTFKCGSNATCLLGSELNETSELFTKIILNKTPIALALDRDALDTKMPKIVRKLQEYNVDVVVVDPKTKTDPGAMTKEEFQNALDCAKPFTWFDRITRKLMNTSHTRLT